MLPLHSAWAASRGPARLVAAAAVAACLFGMTAAAASAASLHTPDGLAFSVNAIPHVDVPALGPLGAGSVGGGLGYDVRDTAGHEYRGTIPGTAGLDGLAATLAQNPLTHDVFLVFTDSLRSRSAEVTFTYWTGQSWADPRALFGRTGAAAAPQLQFLASGDAVLAWMAKGIDSTVLFRHFVLSPSGDGQTYAFVDLGATPLVPTPVLVGSGVVDGIVHVAASEAGDAAYVFLTDPNLPNPGVVRLPLDRAIHGGGFNTIPIPATYTMTLHPEGAGSGGLGSGGGSDAVYAMRLSTYDMRILGAELVYWFEDTVVRGVTFVRGQPSRLLEATISGDTRAGHFAIYRTARQALLEGSVAADMDGAGRSARR